MKSRKDKKGDDRMKKIRTRRKENRRNETGGKKGNHAVKRRKEKRKRWTKRETRE